MDGDEISYARKIDIRGVGSPGFSLQSLRVEFSSRMVLPYLLATAGEYIELCHLGRFRGVSFCAFANSQEALKNIGVRERPQRCCNFGVELLCGCNMLDRLNVIELSR